jgi:hypothetical protein
MQQSRFEKQTVSLIVASFQILRNPKRKYPCLRLLDSEREHSVVIRDCAPHFK